MKKINFRFTLAIVSALSLLAPQLGRADYQSSVLADGPTAYLRLNDPTQTITNKNLGSLGAAGNATNDTLSYKQAGVYGFDPTGIVHPIPGAIVGDGNRAEFFDYTTRTIIPFNAAINTPNTQPFTVEAWFYPSSDQNNTGMAPINNRYTVGSNRQGWTYFQRKVSTNSTGGDTVGWNFKLYTGNGGSSVDCNAVVPFEVGKWLHVVSVYNPTDASNVTVKTYINGVEGGSYTSPGTAQVYQPCTGDHDTATESPAGQPGMSIGCYNNCNTSLNPYFGGVDEFAWYSNALSPAQILAHYQNGTNASRATPYDVLVKSHNPVVYLRLDEIAPGGDVAVNMGDLRSAGIGSHTSEVRHTATGALAGRTSSGAVAYHQRNGRSTTTIPFLSENNPDASFPFTAETWVRPMSDRQNPGAAVMNNRLPAGNRTGWVIFQRAPNTNYTGVSGYSGVGWNFRMYSGSGGGGQDVTTGTDYTVGQWQHLVVTWEPQTDISPALNGAVAWQGILTAYINGVPVATNTAAKYSANTDPTETAVTPADLAVGGYNAASTLGDNPFEGDVGEVAFYNSYVLTPGQILAHYQNGTNSNPTTNYETLVLTAGFGATGTPQAQRASLPKTYLRLNDSARYPAANIGTVGYLADGNLVLTSNSVAGPTSPTYAGFDAANKAMPLDGLKQWASMNNPSGLNITGQITLEAWVKPDAAQLSDPALILSHGEPTYTSYLAGPPPTIYGAPTNGNSVFLKIEGPGPYYYTVGSSKFTNTIGTAYFLASAPAPAGDFTGVWVHLVGTYDGANWRLYRNGVQIAVSAAASGALPVDNGDWAIGSTGNGWAKNYAGAVDEVAIYNTALSASKVASHYLTGAAGTSVLTISKSGGNVTVNWPAGSTLQASTLVTGTYTNLAVPPASSLTVPASGATKFYRWSLP